MWLFSLKCINAYLYWKQRLPYIAFIVSLVLKLHCCLKSSMIPFFLSIVIHTHVSLVWFHCTRLAVTIGDGLVCGAFRARVCKKLCGPSSVQPDKTLSSVQNLAFSLLFFYYYLIDSCFRLRNVYSKGV